jgi:hypothetical protein
VKTDTAKAKANAGKKSDTTKTAEENLLSVIVELDIKDAITPPEEIWAMLLSGPPADDEPRMYKEAMAREDQEEWKKAMEEELEVLMEMGTWDLIDIVDAPPGTHVIGSRWVFHRKRDAAGNIIRYKAHLVAQGFSQAYRVDYFETYSPVVKLQSFCILLSFAAWNSWPMWQLDIKGA